MKKVIIFGPGILGQVVHFYLTKDSDFEVVAFTANQDFIKEKSLFDLPIIPFEKIEMEYPPEKFSMFIAIPYTKMNKNRSQIYYEAKEKGYELISYINSKATIWGDTEIGDNCLILENNVIQPFVRIGNNVIIWSGNHIGHHSTIEDHNFISSHVVISGNVKIKEHCFLGVNSTIRDGITISSECLIGAGSVILHNTLEKQVYTVNSTKLLDLTSDKLSHL